jgi:phosphohistidine phosphatase
VYDTVRDVRHVGTSVWRVLDDHRKLRIAVWIHLFRHGIALDLEDPSCPTDPERPLTDKGRAKTRAAALGMMALDLVPDLLVVSPYLRARQTAEIVIDALDCGDVETLVEDALVPLANPESVSTRLREHVGDARPPVTLCVGHAPNLDRVLAHLVGADEPFTQLKKAGLASVQLRGTTIGHACGRLFALYPPSTLRRLGAGRGGE